jgi:hypothetical protein
VKAEKLAAGNRMVPQGKSPISALVANSAVANLNGIRSTPEIAWALIKGSQLAGFVAKALNSMIRRLLLESQFRAKPIPALRYQAGMRRRLP